MKLSQEPEIKVGVIENEKSVRLYTPSEIIVKDITGFLKFRPLL